MTEQPDFWGEDTSLCARCSVESGGCCCTEAEAAPYCFPLSEPEITRLIPYAYLTGLLDNEPGLVDLEKTRAAVCTLENNLPDFITTMTSLFPGKLARVRSLFPEGGAHYRLRLNPVGGDQGRPMVACSFLGPQGCRLPRAVRPWYCLLFPGWVQGGKVTLFLTKGCRVHEGAKNPAVGLVRIGVKPEAVLALFTQLERDWGLIP